MEDYTKEFQELDFALRDMIKKELSIGLQDLTILRMWAQFFIEHTQKDKSFYEMISFKMESSCPDSFWEEIEVDCINLANKLESVHNNFIKIQFEEPADKMNLVFKELGSVLIQELDEIEKIDKTIH